MSARFHFLLGLFFGLALPALGQMRTFVSNGGDTMEAMIVSHKGGKITIQRGDGREFEVEPSIFSFEVEPSIFSEADREYIRKWMEAHPEDINYDFDIEGTRKKSAAVTESMGSGRYKASNYYYEIGVRNASRDTVSDIKIEYRLFFENSEEIDKDDDSIRFLGDGTRMLQGEQKLERDLEFNRTLFFNTKAVLIEVVDYGHGRRKKDELHGCLVRISGPEGRVITEWTSSELSMQGKTWANTTPRESPAEGPAVIR